MGGFVSCIRMDADGVSIVFGGTFFCMGTGIYAAAFQWAAPSSSLPSGPRVLSGFLLFLSFGRTPGFGIKGGDVIQKEIQIEVQEFLALPVIKVKGIFGVVARKPAAISIDNGSVLVVDLP